MSINKGFNILSEATENIESYTVRCRITKLDNGYMVLITDQQEYGFGTVTFGAPGIIEGNRAMAANVNIFGFKDNIIAKMIASSAATRLKSPIIALIYLKEQNISTKKVNQATIKALRNCIDQITEDMLNKK